MSAIALALRQAARFDRSAVSLRAGLVAAIPVAGVLAAGTLAGDPVAAVTMGAGAMLVGIAWRAGGGRPPLATMVTDTAVMGLSTFAGSATGRLGWLHLVLLAGWAAAAGLIVAVGRRTAVVGTQAIIAFVVFGRFSQPIPAAAGLAGLVIAGGVAQVLVATLFGAPPALSARRSACAGAYRRLAALALDPDARSTAAGAALDEADRTLGTATLLGEAETIPLSALVQEGRRMRLEFVALSLLLAQYVRSHPGTDAPLLRDVERVRQRAVEALQGIAAVIAGDAATEWPQAPIEALSAAVDALADTVRALGEAAGADGREGGAEIDIADRIEAHGVALAGQIRAAAGLAAGVRERRGLLSVRPSLGSANAWNQLLADLAQVRANASLQSPAGRHAVRLAAVVVATEALARYIPLQRSYWIVVAAATVLRPDFGGTFTRGVERMAGTSVGVVLAGLVAVALHPSGWTTVALVGVLAWAAYALFPASFAAGIVFLNAMIVFLLEVVSPSTLATASDRGVDTVIGGTLALLAYVLWPTWSRRSARQGLADLVSADRHYIRAVLEMIGEGRDVAEENLRQLARAARLARTEAEATLEQAATEPVTRRIDLDQARGVMTGLRRSTQAAHVLRLERQGRSAAGPRPELKPLAAGLDRALALIADTVATGIPAKAELPPLRALYRQFAAAAAADGVLLTELDEMVDAVNTVADLLGLGVQRGHAAEAEADAASDGGGGAASDGGAARDGGARPEAESGPEAGRSVTG